MEGGRERKSEDSETRERVRRSEEERRESGDGRKEECKEMREAERERMRKSWMAEGWGEDSPAAVPLRAAAGAPLGGLCPTLGTG